MSSLELKEPTACIIKTKRFCVVIILNIDIEMFISLI